MQLELQLCGFSCRKNNLWDVSLYTVAPWNPVSTFFCFAIQAFVSGFWLRFVCVALVAPLVGCSVSIPPNTR